MTTERSALKEWAVLIDAMARGDFCAMIRKGGIREQRAGFDVHHDRFLMYPTYFHENSAELSSSVAGHLASLHAAPPAPGTIELSWLAHVRAQWRVTDLDLLRRLEGEHGLAWKAVESRFNYRNRPGVHVIAIELHALPQPVRLPEARRYLGCVSWVELDDDVDITNACPVRDPAETEERIMKLRAILGDPQAAEVVSQ